MELLWKKAEVEPNCNAGKHGYWEHDDKDYGEGLTDLWSCVFCGFTYMGGRSPLGTKYEVCPKYWMTFMKA